MCNRLDHFEPILWSLGGPSAPIVGSLGAVLGATSNFESPCGQTRGHCGDRFGAVLRMLAQFGVNFMSSNFLINFGSDLGGVNVDKVL